MTTSSPIPDPERSPGEARDALAPEALAEELSRLLRPGPVPERVDRAVIDAARARLTLAPTRPWRPVLVRAATLAAAAGVALVLWLGRGRFGDQPDRGPGPGSGYSDLARVERLDVDGSGRVDILDALALARAIESEDVAADLPWDMNGDGTVDQRDVDVVAQRAVRIDT